MKGPRGAGLAAAFDRAALRARVPRLDAVPPQPLGCRRSSFELYHQAGWEPVTSCYVRTARAATSYLRDALLVQLPPSSELADDEV